MTPGSAIARTHCRNGHEYTPENTRRKDGARACRVCIREHTKQRRAMRMANTPGLLYALPEDQQSIMRQRVLAHVEPEPNSGCWLWLGTRHHRQQYGVIWLAWLGRKQLAHRIAYLAWNGPIVPPLQVDHRCNNPRCVNPAHLRLLTSRENTLRGNGASARCARKTHCPHGHPYSPENTIILTYGNRYCRICYERKEREKHARRTG